LPKPHLRVGPADAIGSGQIEGFGNPVIRGGVHELRLVSALVFDGLDLDLADVADAG